MAKRRCTRESQFRVLLLVGTIVLGTSAWSQTPTPSPRENVTLRIIVVESAAEAEQLRARVLNGESFAALAAQFSIDLTAEKGGALGRLALSTLRPELRTAVHGLSADHISDVVQVPTGFAVLNVVPDESTGGVGAPARMNATVAAAGSVKFPVDVSGFGASLVAVQIAEPPDGWSQDPRTICDVRTQALTAAQRDLEHDLADSQAPTTFAPSDLLHLHFLLGQFRAYTGRMDDVIRHFEAAYDLAMAKVPLAVLELKEALGIAYLHRAQMESGLFHAPGDRCLLSPRGLLHPLERTADSRKAIEHFTRYLSSKPEELEVRWLLNLAYMALGGYPLQVPPAQFIPPSAFASSEDVGRFTDVAKEAGLSFFAAAGGVIVDDFDNDGRFDVVTTSFDSCAPMKFFRRSSGATFVERSAQAGLAEQLGGLNATQADYDNDGNLDILILRGGWEFSQRKSLLHNNGNGTFTDVTVASGLATPATSTQAAVWTDVDNDGFLDLFVGNENSPAQLFRNQRNGTFQDVARAAGVDRTAFSKGVAAGDYDNDGWPDLFVSNLGGPSFLYHNNRDGTFSEVGRTAGVPGPEMGFATWFFDYDNDGRLDIFVTSYFTSIEETARTYLRLPNNATTLKLYRNLGNGAFVDVSRRVGLDKVYMPMGANFGDIDNDGFLDIYLGTGNPSYASLVPSVLLRNKGGVSFVDVTASSGTGELHKGHGVAFADLDNDGDEEIVFEVGGATPADAHALRLFENPGHGQDWINLKLDGVKSNRSAVGARIAVTVEQPGSGRRTIHRSVGSGGSFGSSPLQQHIGLGRNARIAEIEIWWPTTNSRQRFTDVPTNRTIQITESDASYTTLDRPLARMGPGRSQSASHAH